MGASRCCPRVEVTVCAAISLEGPIEIVGPPAILRLVGLLRLESGATQIPVDERWEEPRGPDRGHGGEAHVDVTPTMLSRPYDGLRRDLRLIDRADGSGLSGEAGANPRELRSVERGKVDLGDAHSAPVVKELGP